MLITLALFHNLSKVYAQHGFVHEDANISWFPNVPCAIHYLQDEEKAILVDWKRQLLEVKRQLNIITTKRFKKKNARVN